MRWAYDRWRDRRSLGGRLLDVAARVDRAGRERRQQARRALAELDRRDREAVAAAAAETAELARLTAEAAELIAALRAGYVDNGLKIFDDELARASWSKSKPCPRVSK